MKEKSIKINIVTLLTEYFKQIMLKYKLSVTQSGEKFQLEYNFDTVTVKLSL